jgi:hypothetical protein
MKFILKNKRQARVYETLIYPIKPSAAFPNLVRLSISESFLHLLTAIVRQIKYQYFLGLVPVTSLQHVDEAYLGEGEI